MGPMILWDNYEKYSIEIRLEKSGWTRSDATDESARRNNQMLRELQENLTGTVTGPIVCCVWKQDGFEKWVPVGVVVSGKNMGDCFVKPSDYMGSGILYWYFDSESKNGDLYVIYKGKDALSRKVMFRVLNKGVTEAQLRKAWSPMQAAIDNSAPLGGYFFV